MSEVRIDTARGVSLAGTLRLPKAAPALDPSLLTQTSQTAPPRREAVIVLVHDFLTDRHGLENRLDQLAAQYRQAGYATFQFDFSGLGLSDDDAITLESETKDIQAVCSWLENLGFTRQAIHANGFGASAVMCARVQTVRTAVLVGAIVGPQSILWENVFSASQLDDLDRHGLTRLPDDNPNPRQWDVVSKQTLADMSLQDPQKIMADLPWPVLMLHGALSEEFPESSAAAAQGFALLPDGSQLVQIHETDAQAAQQQIAKLSLQWCARRLR